MPLVRSVTAEARTLFRALGSFLVFTTLSSLVFTILFGSLSAVAQTCSGQTYPNCGGGGGVYSNTTVVSADACCAACTGNPGCRSWTFLNNTQECNLRKAPAVLKHNVRGKISGNLPAPPSPPPTPRPSPPPAPAGSQKNVIFMVSRFLQAFCALLFLCFN